MVEDPIWGGRRKDNVEWLLEVQSRVVAKGREVMDVPTHTDT